MRYVLSWFALLGATLCAFVGEARASGIEVQPIALTLSEKRASDMLVIANRDTVPVRFQISAFSWQQKPSGELVLEPTNEIMFFPAMLTLNPQESRNIRVGVTVKPGAVEKTYRIFVQELPRMITPDGQSGAAIGMLARMSIPVFLEPSAPKATPSVSKLSAQGRNVRFSLKNQGNSHFRPDTVQLRVKDATGKVAHTEDLRAWYVLAGGVMDYEYVLPEPVCAAAKSLEIEVKAESGAQRASLPDLKCAP